MSTTVENVPNQSLTQFSLNHILNAEYAAAEWLVDRLIPHAGITCITGKPGVGKSFLTLYLAKVIALGLPFVNYFPTGQQSVCILTKEDPQRLIQKRLKLLGVAESVPIVFCDDMSAFCNSDEQLSRLEELLRNTHSSVLIVDSFIRVVGGDENLSKDVTKVHEVFSLSNKNG